MPIINFATGNGHSQHNSLLLSNSVFPSCLWVLHRMTYFKSASPQGVVLGYSLRKVNGWELSMWRQPLETSWQDNPAFTPL